MKDFEKAKYEYFDDNKDMPWSWIGVVFGLIVLFWAMPHILRNLGANIHAFRYLVTTIRGT